MSSLIELIELLTEPEPEPELDILYNIPTFICELIYEKSEYNKTPIYTGKIRPSCDTIIADMKSNKMHFQFSYIVARYFLKNT